MNSSAFNFKAGDVEFPTGSKGETYHAGSLKDSLPRLWIIPGSYERADSIRELWSNVDDRACPLATRPHQYHILTGKYNGAEMGMCSTGIGASAGEISISELIYGGGRIFIRVGTSGCLDQDVLAGDLVVVNESKRNVGTVMEYLGRERMFDYIQSTERVVGALEEACLSLG